MTDSPLFREAVEAAKEVECMGWDTERIILAALPFLRQMVTEENAAELEKWLAFKGAAAHLRGTR